MPTASGWFRAAKPRWRANVIWPFWPSWVRNARTFAPSVTFARGIWRHSKDVFVQVVRLAGEAGRVKVGNVSTDGTKIQGHASRHKAMSYGSRTKAVERLREDIEALVTQAYQQDEAEDAALGSRRGDELPAELARREDRLARIESAMRR